MFRCLKTYQHCGPYYPKVKFRQRNLHCPMLQALDHPFESTQFHFWWYRIDFQRHLPYSSFRHVCNHLQFFTSKPILDNSRALLKILLCEALCDFFQVQIGKSLKLGAFFDFGPRGCVEKQTENWFDNIWRSPVGLIYLILLPIVEPYKNLSKFKILEPERKSRHKTLIK